ncbi:MAG TPA: chemotaxis protein CheW [Gemmataceae bacterium]
MATAESYVLFDLAGTAYAVPSRVVQRLEMVEQVTPVPNAPPFVDGVVFSRGQVVPAVNLRRRFGFDRAAYDLKTRLIVVEHAGRAVGLIVDQAREFVAIPGDSIQPPPEGLAGTSGKYLSGVVTFNDRVVLILDVAEVVNHAAGQPPAANPPAP